MSHPSFVPPRYDSLPLPCPPLNLNQCLQNYFLVRSFQENWTENNRIHLNVWRPAFGNLAAGEHYFQWHRPGNCTPFFSICFLCCPAFNSPSPIWYNYINPLYNTPVIFCVWDTLPDYIPPLVLDILDPISLYHGWDLNYIADFLDLWIDHFTRPVSPTTTDCHELKFYSPRLSNFVPRFAT